MPAAFPPKDESKRLAALIALNILGTERTAEFDIFPGLARELFSAPIAAISLLDKDRQWFKASVGLDVMETPRDVSFCAHAILHPNTVLYVSDATKDSRFADNPLVVGEFGLRFYAGVPILGPTGDALGAICVMDRRPRKVTKAALEQLRQLAIGVGSALRLHSSVQEFRKLSVTDALTGLENRAGFNQRLRDAMARRGVSPKLCVGLLFLDLDRFKPINDLFGHDGGDKALREVAHRLREVTRAHDTVCRFGGDEFCILVEELQEGLGLLSLAVRIHQALAEPFVIAGQVVPLRTSIGIAICPDDASDPESLLIKADAALYDAKQRGRGMTRFAEAETKNVGKVTAGRNEMQEMLQSALLPPGHEPFTLAFQPIFKDQARHLSGFEALVRWQRPDGSVMLPNKFIPAAETTGLVVRLDRWILDRACAIAAHWPRDLTISSNFSAANFFVDDTVQNVRETLKRNGLAPDRLKVEITETVLLYEPARVQVVIRQLQDLGVRIILDDFGAGHASIAYLRDFDFNGLKIDRSFISTIESDPRSLAFVSAIIEMARALGIEACAEGVETPGQLNLLRDRKIGMVQGFLLGSPTTSDEATALIQAQL